MTRKQKITEVRDIIETHEFPSFFNTMIIRVAQAPETSDYLIDQILTQLKYEVALLKENASS